MKVAFFGTPAYAVPTLDALVESGAEVVTVVAQPDRPAGRGKKLTSPPVAERAKALGLNLRQPRAIRSGPFFTNFRKLDLDLAIVVAYGRILPKELLESPRLGCWNAHGSLLPRWRGAAPIERAVQAGDRTTGVCLMQMDEGLDTGDILMARSLTIGEDERAVDLRIRLAHLSAEMVVDALAQPSSVAPTRQPEEGASHAAPMKKIESELDFSRSAAELHNQVRAFYPWPGSQTMFRGEQFKIHRTRVTEGAGEPGEILLAKKRLVVACGTGALEVLEAQLPGKRALPIEAVLNGARIEPGEIMGNHQGVPHG